MARAGRRARRPVPGLPQLLRLARAMRCASTIELEPVHRFVALRHVRFDDLDDARRAHRTRWCATRRHEGEPVDFLDGVVFSRGRGLPHPGQLGRRGARRPATTPASRSTTARSSAGRSTSSPSATTSGAGTPTGSGARGRSGPRTRASAGCGRGASCAATSTGRSSRSRTGTTSWRTAGRAARPPGARAGRAGRRDPDRAHRRVPATGSCARCRSSRSGCARSSCVDTDVTPERRRGPSTRWSRAQPYVNVGFWSTVAIEPGRADGDVNRAIEDEVARARRPQVAVLRRLLRRGGVRPPLRRRDVRPGQEALRPGRTAARRSTTRRCETDDDPRRHRDSGDSSRLFGPDVPVRFTAYDGSAAGDPHADIRFRLLNERGLRLHRHRPRHAWAWPAPTCRGTSSSRRSTRATPTTLLQLLEDEASPQRPPVRELPELARFFALDGARSRRELPPEETPAQLRRHGQRAAAHGRARDAEAIHHHYDVSNAFYEMLLGPSMAYTCAVLPDRGRHASRRRRRRSSTWSAASSASGRACGCSTSAAAGAAWCGTPSCTTASRRSASRSRSEQAAWAGKAIAEEGLGDRARGPARRLPRRARGGLRRGVSSIGLTEHIGVDELPGVLPVPAQPAA